MAKYKRRVIDLTDFRQACANLRMIGAIECEACIYRQPGTSKYWTVGPHGETILAAGWNHAILKRARWWSGIKHPTNFSRPSSWPLLSGPSQARLLRQESQ